VRLRADPGQQLITHKLAAWAHPAGRGRESEEQMQEKLMSQDQDSLNKGWGVGGGQQAIQRQ